MKLYDLITFKKSLEENIDISQVREAIERLCLAIDSIKLQSDNIETHNIDYVNGLVDYYKNLIVELERPLELKRSKIKEINDIITEQSHILYANSYDLEIHNGGYKNVQNNRKLKMHSDTVNLVQQRIGLYTDWRYPALEIGCRDGEWTQHMVAADPLYIIDQFPEFLETTNNLFPAPYQARLRKYLLNKETHDLSALPKNQFAFVFSWGYFNYISLDTVTQVLKQMKTLLRPGGVFMFSYNDGDTPAGMGLAENFGQSYLPKSLLVPTCQAQGFEIINEYSFDPNIHWLEVKQPGTLSTVKAHQVLGEITRKHNKILDQID